jgi:hypothetical protein
MAPKGSSKGKGKAREKMPTSIINRRWSLDQDRIKAFISDHIRGLIRIYNACGIKHGKAWDIVYDIIFFDPVTTCHSSQFQVMWPHRISRSSPFREWWAAFRSYMGQMFDKTGDQMKHLRCDNPCAFGDHVDRSNPQTTTLGKVQCTGEHFSWYDSDNRRAKIDPPSCRQYKPGDFLAVRPLNSDKIICEDDDERNWADLGVLSGGRSRAGDGNDNDNGEREDNMQGGETGTGKANGTKDGKGQRQRKGKQNRKGKGIVKQTPGEVISLVALLCSCRR